jgi:DNA polymerase-3 subunit epsilon
MLQGAPKFFEVANASSKWPMTVLLWLITLLWLQNLRTEFRRLGYDFEARTLCTVELSKKLLPEQPTV